jgi:proteic killer suppression protein
MNIEFDDDDLRRLRDDPRFTGGFPPEVVKAFRKRMQFIQAAADERDFYAMKSLHYERLKGSRKGESSIRLNSQFRLIVRTALDGTHRTIVVVAIEDYH